MISLKSLLFENRNLWKTPDVSSAKDEIDALADDMFLNTNKIYESFKNGSMVFLKKDMIEKIKNVKLSNIESFVDINDFIQKRQKKDPEYVRDWINIKKSLRSEQKMPAPIIMKHQNEYYLLDGKIRLMVSKVLNIPVYGYVFYYR